MKSLKNTILILLSVCFLIGSSQIIAQSADDIMEKHDNSLRQSYYSLVQKNILSTSKYSIKENRLTYIGKPRVVVVESVQKFDENGNQDVFSLINVLEPSSDKGIGLLYYEYYDSNKENDNWMYLPALSKVKRIISTTDESDDSGNFLGTEFCTEDMQIRKITDYTYKVLGEEIYKDRSTWIIEMIPTSERAGKTKYGKVVTWMDKEMFLSHKEDLYDHKGNLYKQHLYKDFEIVDNVWTARKSMMVNFSNHRITNNDVKFVGYNLKVANEFFTQRTFIDFAYRERNMQEFRKHWK